jgi:hypothetical protein
MFYSYVKFRVKNGQESKRGTTRDMGGEDRVKGGCKEIMKACEPGQCIL